MANQKKEKYFDLGIDTQYADMYNIAIRRKEMNSLDKILSAMRTGKYGSVIDTRGNVHIGLINSIMREDGSGKNWIVTLNNRTVSKQVFIHAS
ncbi:MAG: hypothetical protein EBU90_10435 [Proteobacteria bacterium]|nr:hypothetical protein [Pseudomonadota bacterium]NBP14153.1 hypothetical protein [bacterium]